MDNGFCYNTTAASQLCHLPDKDLPRTETVSNSLAFKIFTYVSVIYILVVSKLLEQKMTEFIIIFGEWLQMEWCYCVGEETCNACKDDDDQKHKKRPEQPPVAENQEPEEVQPDEVQPDEVLPDLQVPVLLDEELSLLYMPIPRSAPWGVRRRRVRRFHY